MAKLLFLMRHSWAPGPEETHVGNELGNKWPLFNFPWAGFASLGPGHQLASLPVAHCSHQAEKCHCPKECKDILCDFQTFSIPRCKESACEVNSTGLS